MYIYIKITFLLSRTTVDININIIDFSYKQVLYFFSFILLFLQMTNFIARRLKLTINKNRVPVTMLMGKM